jgi:acetylglutamate kinase
VLAVVRRVLVRENLRLVDALQEAGVRATSIQTGVFEAEIVDLRHIIETRVGQGAPK